MIVLLMLFVVICRQRCERDCYDFSWNYSLSLQCIFCSIISPFSNYSVAWMVVSKYKHTNYNGPDIFMVFSDENAEEKKSKQADMLTCVWMWIEGGSMPDIFEGHTKTECQMN